MRSAYTRRLCPQIKSAPRGAKLKMKYYRVSAQNCAIEFLQARAKSKM